MDDIVDDDNVIILNDNIDNFDRRRRRMYDDYNYKNVTCYRYIIERKHDFMVYMRVQYVR